MSKAWRHRVTILGCGSSGGVPRLGGADGAGDWGACDPEEPKNRRTRCSILVQRLPENGEASAGATTNVLVDTSPDMRVQLLDAACSHVDAVLFTHHHADQTHGLDDLRAFAIALRRRIPVFIEDETAGDLLDRFAYCFRQAPASPYPPILERKAMPPRGGEGRIDGPGGALVFTPFLQGHGSVDSLGFRIGDMAYSSDVVDLPDQSFETLDGVKLWIVDALQPTPHGTHAHLDKTLAWIDRVRPEKAILTNMHVSMDYQTLKRDLPAHVEPAYDGMTLDY